MCRVLSVCGNRGSGTKESEVAIFGGGLAPGMYFFCCFARICRLVADAKECHVSLFFLSVNKDCKSLVY